ncbi:MAG TPA: hypothetical protein VM184_00285 [Gaiellaceae bacterium]|nr:hypothetical protein [Gaiellaceae bacterium]
MAAKRVDPLKAKQAKQKKIAIAGVLLLVALLAFQGPKTMKLLQGPQPIEGPTNSSAAPAPAAPGTTTPAPAGTTTADATAVGEAPQPATVEIASLADSDSAPEAGAGQLLSFERFASKDPFAQQAQPVAAPAPQPAATQTDDEAGPAAGAVTETTSTEGEGAEAPADSGFTTGTASSSAERAVATSIAVNGVAEDVKVEAEFPVVEPTFLLVSIAEDGKSVEVGIAGGTYANGEATLKLPFGKKITLQNTADGSRYELELRAVEGFPLPKKG